MKLLATVLSLLLLSPLLFGQEPDMVRFDPASMDLPAKYKSVKPFLIEKTEVTEGALILYRQSTRFKKVPNYQAHFPKNKQLPANLVDWFEAAAVCEFHGKRLPTLAEWNIAAGVNRTYPWGEAPLDGKNANVCDKSCKAPWALWRHGDGYERVAPIGSYPAGATPEGLLDMAGNLWEWTSTRVDGRTLKLLGKDQPREDFMDEVVIKGGSYGSHPDQMKNAGFAKSPTNFKASHVGFRCVKEVK